MLALMAFVAIGVRRKSLQRKRHNTFRRRAYSCSDGSVTPPRLIAGAPASSLSQLGCVVRNTFPTLGVQAERWGIDPIPAYYFNPAVQFCTRVIFSGWLPTPVLGRTAIRNFEPSG
jgi:hypothetical protein